MANIRLPANFQRRLNEDQSLDGTIKTCLSRFGDIYKENKLYFFPEYTDHGLEHVEKVIAAADILITKHTFENILKSNDLGYYILAVLLHDLGMHINIDGFNCLLRGELDSSRVTELDKKNWSELWTDFLNEARRFNGKTLKAIFGNENLVIRIPPLDHPDLMNGYDEKLIGEFIRRNHPRLAHEIAIYGFPGKTKLTFAEDLNPRTRNIIGLIARSHGMHLRPCMDYIELIYGKEARRHPNNTHATYLMAILRLADYIQIDSTRTSPYSIKTRTFSSPVSLLEHYTHLAIDHVDYKYQDDPERIFVSASPADSQMYLKIQGLVKAIQYELDMSWAVLGELYGAMPDKPAIKYRRIIANLSDDGFIDRQPYVADKFSFKSNDEITKLLIAPLYGDDPKYGARELLQNAIDACRERQQVEDGAGNKEYVPKVLIEVNEELQFKISDNGIGMDIDVIKNYFLQAGASYRKSAEWQLAYLDEQGKSSVQRSGRFGIGVLAAFLIGNSFSVATRKRGANTGFRFQADLSSSQINVIKDTSMETGTTICIQMAESLRDVLKPGRGAKRDLAVFQWFKWFVLSYPQVEYHILGKHLIPFDKLDPAVTEGDGNGWSSFDSPGFKKIMWKYPQGKEMPRMTCNGFIIPHGLSDFSRELGLINNCPNITVFDNDANLPLSLNRNELAGAPPFGRELKVELYKDYIAFLMTIDPGRVEEDNVLLQRFRVHYPGTKTDLKAEFKYGLGLYDLSEMDFRRGELLEKILVSKKGYIIDYNYFIKKLGKVKIIMMQSNLLNIGGTRVDIDLQDRFLYFSKGNISTLEEYSDLLNPLLFLSIKNTEASVAFWAHIYLRTSRYDYLFDPEKKRLTGDVKSKITNVLDYNGWKRLDIRHVDYPTIITADFLKSERNALNFAREHCVQCIYDGDPMLDELLERYLGDDVVIPFSIEERKKKYPLLFAELGDYMEKYNKQ